MAGQPFNIQRDGILTVGIQFTAGEHEFQLFHQQRKGLACKADTLGSGGYVYLAVYPTPKMKN